MAQLAIAGSREQTIRQTSVNLCQDFRQKDFLAEIAAIGGFVRDKIRYIRDIQYCETVQAPEYTLRNLSGDCDDKATLVAAMLMAVGNRCRFIVCDQGRGWCHVWTQVFYSGKWLNIETTEPVPLGHCSQYLRRTDKLMVYPIEPAEA